LLRELYQIARRFAQLSNVDELTSLNNRRFFNTMAGAEVHRSCRENRLIGFFMLDVDFFKRYNDTYGHQRGDDVLSSIGHALSALYRRAGDQLFRLGGEEFGVMLVGRSEDEIRASAEKIRTTIEDLAIEHSGNPTAGCVTVSLGGVIARAKAVDCSIERLYKLADDALYTAKQEGRNRVHLVVVETPGD
jgi:diguanylate cyclase (GGDEF)-like protein